VRSEQQLCERPDYDLLFRFFLDINLYHPNWDATTFTKNRDRLVQHEVARQFFEEVVRQAKKAALIFAEHVTVDGRLIEAWDVSKEGREAGNRPPSRRPRQPDGELSRREAIKRDPRIDDESEVEAGAGGQSKLAREGSGKEAQFCYSGHV